MNENYDVIRKDVKEIESLIKKKIVEDCSITNEDPDNIVLLMRCAKFIQDSDKFIIDCIRTIDEMNMKLDKILTKLK